MSKKMLKGKVISDKNEKTVVVQVKRRYSHTFFKKVVTSCPHSMHTILNEYPDFGGNYEVIHHTELIEELITTGQLKTNITSDKTILSIPPDTATIKLAFFILFIVYILYYLCLGL